MKVGDDLSRNDAKRDAIAAVAERKIGMRKFWSLADVRQAIFSLAERACPCVRYLQVKAWKHVGKATLQLLGLSGNPLLTLVSRGIGHIFAAYDRSLIRRGAEIKIGPRRFLYQRAVRPSLETVTRLANQRERALEGADILFQVLLGLVAGRKHDSLSVDSKA